MSPYSRLWLGFLPYTKGPDTRIPNVTNLLPGPFQLTGPNLPFDAYAGDTVHQYFQMVQQVDCAIDAEHVSKDNPTGDTGILTLPGRNSGEPLNSTRATQPLTIGMPAI